MAKRNSLLFALVIYLTSQLWSGSTMSQTLNKSNTINYIEMPARDISKTKAFFESVFGWSFTDYGSDYMSFSHKEAGVDGGFYKLDKDMATANGSALIVLYSDDLALLEEKIVAFGGKVTVPVFSFPGGKRFHFTDPSGNEFAAWTE